MQRWSRINIFARNLQKQLVWLTTKKSFMSLVPGLVADCQVVRDDEVARLPLVPVLERESDL